MINNSKQIFLSNQVKLPDSVLMEDMAGEAIMLNMTTEQYHALDEVGARMLTVLIESESIQAAIESLLEEFEVEPAVLQADLLEYIEDLNSDGLVEIIS
ncbi:MAG TPA: PqqD family protein [Candidatus Obscuribacterales bacterium]